MPKIEVEIIEALAEAFGIEPDENGGYDLEGYEWRAGCGGYNGDYSWLSLKNVVEVLADALSWRDEED